MPDPIPSEWAANAEAPSNVSSPMLPTPVGNEIAPSQPSVDTSLTKDTSSISTLPSAISTLPLRQSREIQGNVLAPFNKDHQTFLFLSFPDQQRGQKWVGAMATRVAVTADVADFNDRFSKARHARGGDDPENLEATWVGLSLTYPGLVLLNPNLQASLQSFEGFSAKPAARAEGLGDTGLSDPAHWVIGQPDQIDIHALVTVAADDREDLVVELEKMRALAAECNLIIVYEQRGNTLPGERAGHEHFGFKDGISQPGVRDYDIPSKDGNADQVQGKPGTDRINAGEFVFGEPRQPAFGSMDTTPHKVQSWMHNGSFHVFRRLAQDVPGFWAQATTHVHSLASDDPMKEDLLAAKLVGRWRSGTPVDIASEKDNRSTRNPSQDNNFEFNDPDNPGRKDPEGHRCPRFAHIRKMYPRDDEKFSDEQHRILRRGIPFGLPFDPTAGRGHGADAERGLCFVAHMTSIEQQFEFLQRSWANNPEFPDGTAGSDPVIGTDGDNLLKRLGMPDLTLNFTRFVTTTGMLYSFTPSITTLHQLADGTLVPEPLVS